MKQFIKNNGDWFFLVPSDPQSVTEAVAYDTVVFEGPPITEQKLWPKHCVQDSWGAEFHQGLKVNLHAGRASFFDQLL